MQPFVRTNPLRAVIASTMLIALGLSGTAAGATDAPVGATGTAGDLTPLAASNYTVQQVCGKASPGQASCMAAALIPQTTEARARTHPLGMTLSHGPKSAGLAAEGVYGLRPQDLHGAYELPTEASSPQTIALVDAYDDPTAETDLKVYDKEFGLPACTTANHCFEKINEEGKSAPLPEPEGDWALEISLDIETAHAICQNCHILLVEANSSWTYDLEAAEQTAVEAGATEISNSYGGPNGYEGGGYDHPGVVITASTGDFGYDNWADPYFGESANYPADSPDVVAVGGTELGVVDGAWSYENAWREGGSGCNPMASAPSWQQALPDWSQVGCGSDRAVADVSADAAPWTGLAVYDSTPSPYGEGWMTIGGTSLSSPLIAATFALAGGAGGVAYPAQTLYAHLGSSSLHDIVTGSNWGCSRYDEYGFPDCTTAEYEANCGGELICNTGSGYDGPTGVGTPDGIGAFQAAPGEHPAPSEPPSEPPSERPVPSEPPTGESPGPVESPSPVEHRTPGEASPPTQPPTTTNAPSPSSPAATLSPSPSLGVPGATSSQAPGAAVLAPELSDVSLAPSHFEVGARPRLRVKLSRAATVTVSISRTLTGHIARGRCARGAGRGQACATSAHETTLQLQAARGVDTLSLSIPGVTAGDYTATVTAHDAGAGASGAVTLGFAVGRAHRPAGRRG